MHPISPLEQALHAARALVLADLAAGLNSLSRAVDVVSTWSAYWGTAPSGRPVIATVVAPRSKATRNGSM
ncbi:MAG TPA: hypothetical protein VGF17_27055, partial [Phytomonospora sp.]